MKEGEWEKKGGRKTAGRKQEGGLSRKERERSSNGVRGANVPSGIANRGEGLPPKRRG